MPPRSVAPQQTAYCAGRAPFSAPEARCSRLRCRPTAAVTLDQWVVAAPAVVQREPAVGRHSSDERRSGTVEVIAPRATLSPNPVGGASALRRRAAGPVPPRPWRLVAPSSLGVRSEPSTARMRPSRPSVRLMLGACRLTSSPRVRSKSRERSSPGALLSSLMRSASRRRSPASSSVRCHLDPHEERQVRWLRLRPPVHRAADALDRALPPARQEAGRELTRRRR